MTSRFSRPLKAARQFSYWGDGTNRRQERWLEGAAGDFVQETQQIAYQRVLHGNALETASTMRIAASRCLSSGWSLKYFTTTSFT